MPWFDELVRGLTEGASGVTAREKYGPDWREQLAERQAGRERAAAGEERASASEQIRLADELAKAVSETMAAGEEGGPEQDYSAAIPADLLGRAGVSAEDVLGRARGKTALNKRQLEILRGAQRMEQERARQTGATERQGAANEAAMARERERNAALLERAMKLAERPSRADERDALKARMLTNPFELPPADEPIPAEETVVPPGQHRMPDGSVMADSEMGGPATAPPGKDPNRPVKFRGQMVPFSSLPPELQKKIEANGG